MGQRSSGSLESIPERGQGGGAAPRQPDQAHAVRASVRLQEGGGGGRYLRSHSLPGPVYIPGSVFGGAPSGGPARSALPARAEPAAARGAARHSVDSRQPAGSPDRPQNPLRRVIMGGLHARDSISSSGSGPGDRQQEPGAAGMQAEERGREGSLPGGGGGQGGGGGGSSWFFSRNASFKAPDNPWG
jgi:hypothetical protein